MAIVDFSIPLYEPQETDEYWQPENTQQNHAPVNLNAISYYASLSLKPKRIGHLVGVAHSTIYKVSKLREAYERGAAHHELWLRSVLMEASKVKPGVALAMLDRSAGPADVDFNDGKPEDEQSSGVVFELKFPTFQSKTLTESERAELDKEPKDED